MRVVRRLILCRNSVAVAARFAVYRKCEPRFIQHGRRTSEPDAFLSTNEPFMSVCSMLIRDFITTLPLDSLVWGSGLKVDLLKLG